MQIIGFIYEIDKNKYSVPYELFMKESIPVAQPILDEILDFLSSGEALWAQMGFFCDLETGEEIAPLIYYTNGKLIWPSYLSYYIKSKGVVTPSVLHAISLNINESSNANKNVVKTNNNDILKQFLASFKHE